jgi:hypothetical protein
VTSGATAAQPECGKKKASRSAPPSDEFKPL